MAGKMVRCLCSNYEFGSYGPDGSAESYTDYGTGCTQSTTRVFAMGHDAKLVGFMVRAELAGEDIVTGRETGVIHTWNNAVLAAMAISEALGFKAQAQLDAARARIAKKEAREAAKTARKSAKVEATIEPTTRQARIKVGRWEYDATIEIATGEATYTSKQGVAWTKPQGEYTEV